MERILPSSIILNERETGQKSLEPDVVTNDINNNMMAIGHLLDSIGPNR